jgi:hypothetical protein
VGAGPTDRMVAHTGYLIFGRPIILNQEKPVSKELMEEAGLIVEAQETFLEVESPEVESREIFQEGESYAVEGEEE